MRVRTASGVAHPVRRWFFGCVPAVVLAATVACPGAIAQLSANGKELQIHGFASQGFLYSSGNNYLTTQSTQGSFALTDGGLNLSAQFMPKLRVGAQVYIRDVGKLGRGLVTLDWALADYRFSDWFGIRAGQVKTVQGLYNDTQDLEFLHTWALLPQALYPLDLRGSNISHLGGDLYGSMRPKKLGTFSYTAFAGKSPADRHGGEQYGLQSYGYFVGPRRGRLLGVDLKWNTPFPGLLLGAAYLDGQGILLGKNINFGGPFRTDTAEIVVTTSAQ